LPDTRFDPAADLNAAAARGDEPVATRSEDWQVLYLRGAALLQLGRFREAIDAFSQVAALRPQIPDVHNNLGVAFQAVCEFDAANRAYQTAIALRPDFDLAHANLGRLLISVSRLADAENSLRRAVELKPTEATYRLQLADVLGRQNKWEAAESAVREAIQRQPHNLDLRMNLAAALVHQGRLSDATDVYRSILEANPNYIEAHSSLAFVLERQGHLPEALWAARKAVALRPDFADAFNNLGVALRSLHCLDEACAAFRRAIELNPDFALAEFNLGTTLLLAGRYAEGWTGYRQHARLAGTKAPGDQSSEWDGRAIPDQTLLVYADQGFGDTIQFVRFLRRCKERSQAHVVFRCQRLLCRLFADCGLADDLSAVDDDLPAFDSHISLASLPGLLGVTIEQVGDSVTYLRPAATLPGRIASLIGKRTADRSVGLVWQGNPRQTRDVVRSCPLEKFLPLLQVPGTRFFSLQCDSVGRSQLDGSGVRDRLVDVGAVLEDFADTAAVLQELDLLITVDTAIAHLAGALGRPVWTLLCHTPDWRWHLDLTDSPWYSTMRLFRQPAWGDWDCVIEQIAIALGTS
jgi:Flp pilus assembly protein TadD